ncbi:carboxypeptidase-like regulatory domain-containing protein [Archangium primigenium]|uniref:carboxypeptidase-like regulatory domain-containing protein n=1 Tax=[Archangium] primigenium TaxID=2792470 RepID=UPI001957F704|nr:carboxypeptidase-like regulatory domain-containing protein [Archangium primigenium]MBM7119503.1 carboxypeptidase regulatory-like domain-containing protein [Archangium primigenium]
MRWAVVVPFLVMGCGPGGSNGDGIADGVLKPDSVSAVAPATPKGTVSGQVLDTRMQPLTDATVTLLIGSDTSGTAYSKKTDGAGNFMFTGVPAGSGVLVTASKDGYATLRANTTVPSSAGNIPINNGNASLGAMMLADTSGSVSFTLYTPSGHPAANARAYLEATPAGMLAFNGTEASTTSSVIATPVLANEMGIVTFSGVPSPGELARIGGAGFGGYRLFVDPVDYNGDGIIDAAGTVAEFSASSLIGRGYSQLVRLESPTNTDGGGTFNLVATNLASLQATVDRRPSRNLLREGESIFLGFNQPVLRESMLAILTDESGRDQIDVTVTANATGDVYSITPAAGRIAEGQEYNLILRATSAYSGLVRTWKGSFVRGDVKSPRALAITSVTFKDLNTAGNVSNVLDAGECVVVTFNQVVSTNPGAVIPLEATLSGGPETLNIKTVLPASYPATGNACFPGEATKFPIDSAASATTRFYFQYGTAGAAGYPPLNPRSVTANLRMEFTKFQLLDLASYYETAWGVPVPATTVLEKQLLAPQP